MYQNSRLITEYNVFCVHVTAMWKKIEVKINTSSHYDGYILLYLQDGFIIYHILLNDKCEVTIETETGQ